MHALVGDCNLVTVGFVMMHTLAVLVTDIDIIAAKNLSI